MDRGGIAATKVDVLVDGQKDLPREEFLRQPDHEHAHQHHEHEHPHQPHEHEHPHQPHEHEHERGHPHEHQAGDEHEHAHPHGHHPHRGLKQIREIIRQAVIPDAAKQTATAIFEALGEAEAKIHHQDVESIEFHEVGSADAIVDIVCAAVGADALRVEHWVCSPLNVGGGVVKCAHGTLPVPAPATLELLKNAPVYSSGVQKELVTPTGAAIVRTLAAAYGDFPAMTVEAVGYGAGGRDLPGMPNVTRLSVGESACAEERQASPPESVTIMEANIDDMNPQLFGYAIDRLLEAGALDVYTTPVQMKKSRPGLLLTVSARNQDVERLSKMIFTETTTLGMRMRQDRRLTLKRQQVMAATPWGEVRVKLGSLDGAVCNAAPEFEDCRRLAAAHNVPLKRVMQEALRSYFSRQDQAAVSEPPKG